MKIKPINLLLYIQALLLIVLSGSVTVSIGIETTKIILYKILFVACGCVLILAKKNIINKLGYFIFCSLGYLTLNLVVYPEGTTSLLSGLIMYILILSTIILCNEKKYSFFDYVYKVIIVIATFSIFMFVSINILHLPVPYSMIYTGEVWSLRYQNYFNLFYINPTGGYIPLFGGEMHRLSGIFWEPGMYAAVLNLALLYHYVTRNNNKKHRCLLLISILCTFSATGVVLAIIIYGYFYVKDMKKSTFKMMFVPILLVLSSTAIIFVVVDKIAVSNLYGAEGSFYARVIDLIEGIEVFYKKPLLGYGFNNISAYTNSNNLSRAGNSNGLIIWLLSLGIVGFSLYIMPALVNISRMRRGQKMEGIFSLFCILICFSTEPLFGQPLMWLIIASEHSRLIKRSSNSVIVGDQE